MPRVSSGGFVQSVEVKASERLHIALIGESLREPGVGIERSEPLGQNLSGSRSRRITDEHRLVYKVDGDSVIIIQARSHY